MRGSFGFGLALAALATTATAKVYTAAGIDNAIDRMKRPFRPSVSIATDRHEHKRAIARRLRQQARDEANQRARAAEVNGYRGVHIGSYDARTGRHVDLTGAERISTRWRPIPA